MANKQNIGQRIGNGIKEKAKDFWAGLKAGFSGLKGMSKEQFDELVKKSTDSANEVGTAMDTDNDGGITTKDIKDGFKEK